MRRLLLMIAICALGATAVAQDPPGSGAAAPGSGELVVAELEPLSVYDVTVRAAELYVGQPALAVLRVHGAETSEITSVRITDTPHVEVLSFEIGPSDEAGVTELLVSVAAFRPGTHVIAGLEIQTLEADGSLRTATAPAFELPVLSALSVDDDHLLPPGPFEPVYTRNLTALYGGVLLGAGFLLGLLALLWRRRQQANAEILVELPPPRPADEVALEALDVLEHSGWLESGRHIDYHLRLSEILREFVGRTFAFHATEMTTEEVMGALDRIPEDTAQFRETIREQLRQMDLVKFAKASLPLDESREMLAQTIDLVVAVTEQRRARALELQRQAELPDVADDAPPVSEVP